MLDDPTPAEDSDSGDADDPTDSHLEDLARRVADGESVDWEKEEQWASATREQRKVRGMKELAELAAAARKNQRHFEGSASGNRQYVN